MKDILLALVFLSACHRSEFIEASPGSMLSDMPVSPSDVLRSEQARHIAIIAKTVSEGGRALFETRMHKDSNECVQDNLLLGAKLVDSSDS